MPPSTASDLTIESLNSDAKLAASSRPIMTTEIGWTTTSFSETAIAQYVVDATLDGIRSDDRVAQFGCETGRIQPADNDHGNRLDHDQFQRDSNCPVRGGCHARRHPI